VEWDIIGLAVDEGIACVNLFKIRGGRMMDKINFVYNNPANYGSSEVENATPLPDPASLRSKNIKETLQIFLEDYYSQTSDAPKEIILPEKADNEPLIQNLIKTRFKKTPLLNAPQKGTAVNLLSLSRANAEEYLKNYLSAQAGHLDKAQRGLLQLKEVLKMEKTPSRIECYDISNIQGTNSVGSMVVFENGLPKKSEYRKFKIRTKDTPDDFAMMREMLSRRLNRIKNQELRIMNANTWPMPDLIVIDGGKGQLSAALSTLSAKHLALSSLPIIGLAKRIEEIFVPNQKDPIILSHDQPGLQLLQRLRDEAHRFGITYHRSLRSKEAVRSALDDIPGVGPKTKKLLKAKFGTVDSIRGASVDELIKVVGEKMAIVKTKHTI
jgi:excinuclease ABC subunit C